MLKRKLLRFLGIFTGMSILLSNFSHVSVNAAKKDFIIKKDILVKYVGKSKIVKIPKNVKSIGKGAFYSNKSIKRIVIPKNVKVIGKEAFYGCINLRNVKLENGIKKIEAGAFKNCEKIKTIKIPKTVQKIEKKAFLGCEMLEKVIILNEDTKIEKNAFDKKAIDDFKIGKQKIEQELEEYDKDVEKKKEEKKEEKKQEKKENKKDTTKSNTTVTSTSTGGSIGDDSPFMPSDPNPSKKDNKKSFDTSPEVIIKDEKLKEAIIFQLKHQGIYSDNQKITQNLMSRLKGLNCNLNFTQSRSGGIKDLSGLEFATNITILDLSGNEILDLTPIKNCKKLEILELDGQYNAEKRQELSDISPLSQLENLKKLILKSNKIKDVSAISGMVNLEELDLYGNRGVTSIAGFEKLTKLKKLLLNRTGGISDISALRACKDLEELSIQNNKVDNLEALSEHTNLQLLDISGNKISDLTPISSCTNLSRILANSNTISSLEAIKDLTKLKELHIPLNKVTDLTPISNLTNLEDLDLGNNTGLTSLLPLKNLTKLTSLKLVRATTINDFSPISYLKNLEDLDVIASGIEDISFLNGLNKIEEMSLQNNKISDITPIANLEGIREVKLGGNKICDASAVSQLRSKFNVAIEMGNQEIEIEINSDTFKNPIIDQKGKKLDVNENDNIKNEGENIKILNFASLTDGKVIKVKWGVDAEFLGTIKVKIKKPSITKTVNTVTITSADNKTEVEKGKSLQLTAEITGDNLTDEDKKVTWQIEGNHKDGTNINDEGLLSVSTDEDQSKITIKAISKLDDSKMASKEISIIN